MTEEILSSLRRINRAINLHSRALLLRCGLTGPQLIVLRQLNRDGQIPIGCLAKNVSLSQATVTGIIERLVNRGLVVKARDPEDRRRMLVSCTEAGRQTAETAPSVLQERFVGQLAQLEDWERHQMLAALLRISSMMQADRLDAIEVALGPSDETIAETPQHPIDVILNPSLEIDVSDTT